jgi:hypothetical protein
MCRQVSPCLDKLPKRWDRSREICSSGLGGEANRKPRPTGSSARKTRAGRGKPYSPFFPEPEPEPEQGETFAALVIEQVPVDRRVKGGVVGLEREVVAAFLGALRAGSTDLLYGGEGGIRTPDRLAPMPHFECGAFNHSATSPGANQGDALTVGASSRRGCPVRQGSRARNFAVAGRGNKGWDRQTRKTPAVPCRLIEIAGREVRLRGPA